MTQLETQLKDFITEVTREQIRREVIEFLDGRPPVELMDASQAAKYLGVSVQSIYIYVKKGVLQSEKRGRYLLFKKSNLDKIRGV